MSLTLSVKATATSRRYADPDRDLVEAGRLITGRIDAASGAIVTGDLSNPDVDDVLYDAGEYTLKSGGDVSIYPIERMPTRPAAATIDRY